MPIKRDEFEKGRKIPELERAALQFLGQQKDKAFTANEMARELRQIQGASWLADVLSVWNMSITLDNLVKDGQAQKRVVAGETYYRAK